VLAIVLLQQEFIRTSGALRESVDHRLVEVHVVHVHVRAHQGQTRDLSHLPLGLYPAIC
jgi:hypothetical protein